MMKEQCLCEECLCLHESRKDDEVAVPARAQEHEPCPTPPHPTCLCLHESRKDDEVEVPACAQEHERYCPTPPPKVEGRW